MNKITELYSILPNEKINWDLILSTILYPFKDALKSTPQEEKWHGEGDVLTHTMMVCEELIKLDEYNLLEKDYQLVLFLSALFHDIAKPSCTKIVKGEIRSFNHPANGALMTKNYFSKELGLNNNKKYEEFTGAITFLVRYHSEPTYFNYEKNKEELITSLYNNKLKTKYFSNQLLYLLAKADVLGRISDTNEEKLEYIEEFKELAIKLNYYK